MVRLIACGDLALARGVERTYGEKGIAGMVSADLLRKLRAADLVLANIECPVTDAVEPAWTHFPTMKAGRAAGAALLDLNVTVGTLANNHIADYGRRGMDDTLSFLAGSGLLFTGAGSCGEEAARPLVFVRDGVRFGVLALAQPEISAAGEARWGAAVLEEESAVARMRALRRAVDVAIACLHFGVEFFEYPTPGQVRLARRLVDAGAVLVLGHHPHVPQGWERYGKGFIAYSLGNFLFDMAPPPGRRLRVGLLVEADFDGAELLDVRVVPIETARGRTRMLDTAEAAGEKPHLESLCAVLEDAASHRERYYFVCKGNLAIHLKALAVYLFKTGEWRRALDVIRMQRWPQILELRRDLGGFLTSGDARMYEQQRSGKERGDRSIFWMLVCRAAGLLNTSGPAGGRP